ncbi:flavin reductase family protein [Salinicoccus siamensis]|uniref:Flavin reductase family protein n=1 Tax=Salinicoccus siamensis TaxID=381830 RepID=A0ABV5Z278_9STAP
MRNMLNFAPHEVTAKEKKKFMIGSVIPRPIALVSTQSGSGVVNIAPFSYFNIVTYNPPMLSIAVQRADGNSKDTARNILESGEAVVQMVDTENVESANAASAPLAPEESELDVSQFTAVASDSIGVPGVNEAKVRFETKLYDSIVIYNDDGIATADVLLLKVQHYHIDDGIYQDGYIAPIGLGAVSRLAGNDYAEIGRMFTVERPQ